MPPGYYELIFSLLVMSTPGYGLPWICHLLDMSTPTYGTLLDLSLLDMSLLDMSPPGYGTPGYEVVPIIIIICFLKYSWFSIHKGIVHFLYARLWCHL